MFHAILLLPLLLFVSVDIKTIDTLDPLETELACTEEGTLLLLDIGGTLLVHKNAALHTLHKEWKLKWFEQNHPNLTGKEKLAITKAIQEDPGHWQLVDNKWPSLIAKAQDSCKVVALTKTTVDPSLTNLRLNRLKTYGIELKDEFSGIPNGKSYVYSDGVVQTNAPLKGPVLEELLLQLDVKPTKIIFVDNRRRQIESIHKACEHLGIPFLGFEYTAILKSAPPLDEEVANHQLQTLVHEHRLPSEEETRRYLDK